MQSRERAIDSRVVALDNLGPAAAVRLCDRRLDPFDRLLARHHAGEREEAGLEDDVDASRKAGLARDPACIDDMEIDVLGQDLLLNRTGKRIPDRLRRMRAIEQ